MFHSLKLCFNSHLDKAKTLLHNLNFPKTLIRTRTSSKKRTPKSPPPSSCAAAMEAPIQLRHVFNLIDADGDGKISSSELRQVLLKLGHVDYYKDEDKAATEEAEGMIREMDCNGDGLVDLDEFLSVFGNGNDPNHGAIVLSRESEIVEAFRVFDADRNGFISAEELHRVLARLGITGHNCSVRHCREMIRGVDRDGDGFVNLEEFKSMMTAGIS